MKMIRKLITALLVVAMIAAVLPAAFAEGGDDSSTSAPPEVTTHTITAPAATNGVTHTYNIYQIFTGKVVGNQLTEIMWGKNGAGEKDTAVAADKLAALQAVKDSTEQVKLTAIANVVTMSDPFEVIDSGETAQVPTGYYLVEDKYDDVLEGEYASATLYVVEIVNSDVEITPKADVPKLEKKVIDTNDSDGLTSGWQDSADHDVNDVIRFQLTATLGDRVGDYSKYYIQFCDTMDDGLTFNEITSVKINGTGSDVQNSFVLDPETPDDNTHSFTLTCENVKTLGATKKGDTIVVEYTATLNSNALMGSAGNKNTASLKFSNNPNWTGSGTPPTGETPEDTVIVFTYKVVVDKVDGNKQPLAGAVFELFKVENGVQKPVSKGQRTGTVPEDGSTNKASQYIWERLDDGDYILHEVSTPGPMYNAIADIEFSVVAGHVVKADLPTLTSLTGDTFSGNVSTGALTAQIENNTGAVLPSTGGMGTTLFYVIGAVLVISAGVLLVAKKRVEA